MSAIFHDSGLPQWIAPRLSFSFYEQAIIEVPAPVKYQVAQAYKHLIEKQFGPEWHYEIGKSAHQVYLRGRPWWVTMA